MTSSRQLNGSSQREWSVFINCPFDPQYKELYLALIASLCMLGLIPRSILEINREKDRLTSIFKIINECRYSIHDLSRVDLSQKKYPGFNMPFEAGLAMVAQLTNSKDHVETGEKILKDYRRKPVGSSHTKSAQNFS